jgi:hypothetical protein
VEQPQRLVAEFGSAWPSEPVGGMPEALSGTAEQACGPDVAAGRCAADE